MSMIKGPLFNRNHKGRNGFTHRSRYAICLVELWGVASPRF